MLNNRYFEAFRMIYDLLKITQDAIAFPVEISLTLIENQGFKLTFNAGNSKKVDIQLSLRRLFAEPDLYSTFKQISHTVKVCLEEEIKKEKESVDMTTLKKCLTTKLR